MQQRLLWFRTLSHMLDHLIAKNGGGPMKGRKAPSFYFKAPGIALAHKQSLQQAASSSDGDSSASEVAAEQASSIGENTAADALAGRGHRIPRPVQRAGLV